MQKIVTLRIDDVCADAQDITRMLAEACHRPSGTYRVTSISQAGENAYAVLCPAAPGQGAKAYRFVQIQDDSSAGITSLLAERWAAGFDVVGSINLADGLALFLFAETSP